MATQPSSRTAEKPRGESGNGPGRGWPEKNGGLRGGQSLTSSSQDIHRTPPHSVEAEQGVLGSMLISPREAIGECVEKINEEYFYVPAHQTIYNVLVDLWNAGQAIDLITFTQVLRDRTCSKAWAAPHSSRACSRSSQRRRTCITTSRSFATNTFFAKSSLPLQRVFGALTRNRTR